MDGRFLNKKHCKKIEHNVLQIPEVAVIYYFLFYSVENYPTRVKSRQFGWSAVEPGNLLLSDVFDEFIPNFQKVHGRTFRTALLVTFPIFSILLHFLQK